jgi:hypothetical protein
VKHVELHQTIINRGAQPEETPEHNAMQVLFLDDDFCVRFAQALPDADKRLARATDALLERRARSRTRLKEEIERLRPVRDAARLAACQQIQAKLDVSADVKFTVGREFEQRGIDVLLRVELVDPALEAANDEYRRVNDWRMQLGLSFDPWESWVMRAIEIKPSVGDDYPAVLRQMRANHSDTLFVGQYSGRGATRDQFVKTFESAAKVVIFQEQLAEASR